MASTDAGVSTRVTFIGGFRVLSPRRHLCFYSVSKNTVADPGEGLPPSPRPLFLAQTEARRAEKNFFGDQTPLSEGLDPPLKQTSYILWSENWAF